MRVAADAHEGRWSCHGQGLGDGRASTEAIWNGHRGGDLQKGRSAEGARRRLGKHGRGGLSAIWKCVPVRQRFEEGMAGMRRRDTPARLAALR
jgi:hypothetical protein